jgi:hypothetical protein
MARRLSEAYDNHVVDKIETANPPSGSTGTDLISKIRNAIADMSGRGAARSVVALTPQDAAQLELAKHPSGDTYVFVPDTGGQQVVWRLAVRETPFVSDPLLVDPNTLGLSYTAEGGVLVDPFHEMKTNQVRVRVEAEAVFHVRNISQGAYVIA